MFGETPHMENPVQYNVPFKARALEPNTGQSSQKTKATTRHKVFGEPMETPKQTYEKRS